MTNTLTEFSAAMANLVEQAAPSVVRVEARRRLPATGIVWSPDGLVVTANHVVELDENIPIGLADGRTLNGSVVGRDATTDIAILRVDASDLPAATWADDNDLRVGHLVLALGRPGNTVQATLGIISAVGLAWQTAAGGKIDRYVQTDVAMYPGFSGGPLLTATGEFAGLNSSHLTRGVSVTVPAATLRRTATTLQTHGRMPRGYLGVGIQPVRLSSEVSAQFGQDTGLMVMSVEIEGPAAAAGVLQGDILVTLDGHALQQIDDLQGLLGADRVGQATVVKLVRGGSVQELTVAIGEHL